MQDSEVPGAAEVAGGGEDSGEVVAGAGAVSQEVDAGPGTGFEVLGLG